MTASFNIARGTTVFVVVLSALVLQVGASVSSMSSLDGGGAGGSATVPSDDRAIAHALNRLGFGARPGDVARVKEKGLATWIDQQLGPDRLADEQLDTRLARLTTLSLDAKAVAQNFYIPARLERRARQQQGPGATAQGPVPRDQTPGMGQGPAPRPPAPGTRRDTPGPMDQASGARDQAPMNDVLRRGRQVFAEMSEAKLLRAVYSERQLEEVLVDFWFNHFNVFARKGQTEIYIGEYEREAIRPHVMGTFRDLLGATAKSPAMLVYLDNWMSADPNAAARRGDLRRPNQQAQPKQQAEPNQLPPNPQAAGRMRGLNENYARELLELHTLGVDGGYTQQDVVEVARAFTGWTIGRPNEPGYRFTAAMHDRGAKKILGHAIASGGGVEDGEKVLDILASHPATARHIAFKLAQRFVSDAPPASVVDRAAEKFRATNGNLREVVRTIVTSPEFFAPDAYQAKVKTPFEFVASALRATRADIRSAQSIIRTLADLGMPLYLCQPPTGYDETAAAWVSSGALVSRINFALAVAKGEIRGVQIPTDGAASALTLGSAEFQRQ